MAALANAQVALRPKVLTQIPLENWPPAIRLSEYAPREVWSSRQYLVQLFDVSTGLAHLRLSINRITVKPDGRWEEDLSWEELMECKRQVGYAHWYAVEVYPPDDAIVNVANMRHLWLCRTPLPISF